MNVHWIESVYYYRFPNGFYLFIQKYVSGQDAGNSIFRCQYVRKEIYVHKIFKR